MVVFLSRLAPTFFFNQYLYPVHEHGLLLHEGTLSLGHLSSQPKQLLLQLNHFGFGGFVVIGQSDIGKGELHFGDRTAFLCLSDIVRADFCNVVDSAELIEVSLGGLIHELTANL